MPARFRPSTALAVVAFVALLAGCAAPAPAPSPTRSTPRASGPSSTPSASPTLTAKPPLDSLTLDADGLGGPNRSTVIKVGKPMPSTTGPAAVATWDPSACVGEGVKPGDPYSGTWTAAYPSGPGFSGGDDSPAFSLDSSGTRTGEVDWILVLGTKVGTREGVHVGSPLSAVTKAYPKPAGVVHLGLSDLYVIAGTVGQLTIEVTTDDGSGYWQPGQVGRVFALSSRPVGSEPVGVVATDNVPGCKV